MISLPRLSQRTCNLGVTVLGWMLLLGLTLAGWFLKETMIGKVLAVLAALWWGCGLAVFIAWLRERLKTRIRGTCAKG